MSDLPDVLSLPLYDQSRESWTSYDAATWSAKEGKFVANGAVFYRENLI